jgi:hypothetical protein
VPWSGYRRGRVIASATSADDVRIVVSSRFRALFGADGVFLHHRPHFGCYSAATGSSVEPSRGGRAGLKVTMVTAAASPNRTEAT